MIEYKGSEQVNFARYYTTTDLKGYAQRHQDFRLELCGALVNLSKCLSTADPPVSMRDVD